jgi:hypothetical protein
MNNESTFEKNNNELYVAINSMQQTAFVERIPLPNRQYFTMNDILPYDIDNLYPNKVKSMCQRSQTTMAAIETLAEFSQGQGFENELLNEIIVNRKNQTLLDILMHIASEKSMFSGIALHFNYNIFGEIIEINEVPFETLRWKYDETKLIFNNDWFRNSVYYQTKRLEFFPFNPENVKEEIELVSGFENYTGQVLYWIPKRKEIYPLAKGDRCLDDTQFEHESGLYKLRNVQNDYSSGHIMFYPNQLQNELEKEGLIQDIKKSRGASNAGRTKAIPVNTSALQAMGNRKMIEEIPRTGVDKLFAKQNEETRFNIFSAFKQPPILSGIANEGMFNQESYKDAFDYYNSRTKSDRQYIERIFNIFMPYTIWGVDNIKIKPLEFVQEIDSNQNNNQIIEE